MGGVIIYHIETYNIKTVTKNNNRLTKNQKKKKKVNLIGKKY